MGDPAHVCTDKRDDARWLVVEAALLSASVESPLGVDEQCSVGARPRRGGSVSSFEKLRKAATNTSCLRARSRGKLLRVLALV